MNTKALLLRRGNTEAIETSNHTVRYETVLDITKITLAIMQGDGLPPIWMEREGFLNGKQLPANPVLSGGDRRLLSHTAGGWEYFDLAAVTEQINQSVTENDAAIHSLRSVLASVQQELLSDNTQIQGIQSEVAAIQQALQSDDSALDTFQEFIDAVKLNKDSISALKISSILGLQSALEGKMSTGHRFSYDDLLDKPSFADLVHTHTIEQVVGLREELDAAASSGGTGGGSIKVKNGSDLQPVEQIRIVDNEGAEYESSVDSKVGTFTVGPKVEKGYLFSAAESAPDGYLPSAEFTASIKPTVADVSSKNKVRVYGDLKAGDATNAPEAGVLMAEKPEEGTFIQFEWDISEVLTHPEVEIFVFFMGQENSFEIGSLMIRLAKSESVVAGALMLHGKSFGSADAPEAKEIPLTDFNGVLLVTSDGKRIHLASDNKVIGDFELSNPWTMTAFYGFFRSPTEATVNTEIRVNDGSADFANNTLKGLLNSKPLVNVSAPLAVQEPLKTLPDRGEFNPISDELGYVSPRFIASMARLFNMESRKLQFLPAALLPTVKLDSLDMATFNGVPANQSRQEALSGVSAAILNVDFEKTAATCHYSISFQGHPQAAIVDIYYGGRNPVSGATRPNTHIQFKSGSELKVAFAGGTTQTFPLSIYDPVIYVFQNNTGAHLVLKDNNKFTYLGGGTLGRFMAVDVKQGGTVSIDGVMRNEAFDLYNKNANPYWDKPSTTLNKVFLPIADSMAMDTAGLSKYYEDMGDFKLSGITGVEMIVSKYNDKPCSIVLVPVPSTNYEAENVWKMHDTPYAFRTGMGKVAAIMFANGISGSQNVGEIFYKFVSTNYASNLNSGAWKPLSVPDPLTDSTISNVAGLVSKDMIHALIGADGVYKYAPWIDISGSRDKLNIRLPFFGANKDIQIDIDGFNMQAGLDISKYTIRLMSPVGAEFVHAAPRTRVETLKGAGLDVTTTKNSSQDEINTLVAMRDDVWNLISGEFEEVASIFDQSHHDGFDFEHSSGGRISGRINIVSTNDITTVNGVECFNLILHADLEARLISGEIIFGKYKTTYYLPKLINSDYVNMDLIIVPHRHGSRPTKGRIRVRESGV